MALTVLQAKKWVSAAINLFGKLDYDDPDAFAAVKEMIQRELDSAEDKAVKKDLELIAEMFEEDYKRYFGHA